MRLPIPESVKRRIRPLPVWSAIAMRDPQDAVDVIWTRADGHIDVTHKNVVAALRPLTVAIVGLAPIHLSGAGDGTSRLDFTDRVSGSILGFLQLRAGRHLRAAGVELTLFDVAGGVDACVGWARQAFERRLRRWRRLRTPDPHNFEMPDDAVRQLGIFYSCPRPVVLVSVDDGAHSNIFPMDLIGPLGGDWFTLALRSTSQSVPAMCSARRMAISSLPASHRDTAYRLGVHHRRAQVDWSALPFGVARSARFALPVPDIAPRIRELEAVHVETIGSHTFFVTRVMSDTGPTLSPLLHHTSGSHQHFRAKERRPFPAAG